MTPDLVVERRHFTLCFQHCHLFYWRYVVLFYTIGLEWSSVCVRVEEEERKRERKPAQEVELGPFTICSGAWMGVQLLLANPREKWFQSLTLLETNDKSLFHPPQRDACHSFILAEHKVMPLAFYLPLVI